MKKLLELSGTLALALTMAAPAMAEGDIANLRRQLAEQRVQNQAQQQQLEQQAQAIDQLSRRLDLMTADKAEEGRRWPMQRNPHWLQESREADFL